MEKFSNGILKTLAAVGVILFVLTLGIALVFFNAEKRLFNAQLYLDALESQNLYERLPALAAESIAAAPASEDPDSPRTHLSMLPAENWETIFRALLPADVSQPMTRQAITSVFDYLNGKNESASLSLVDFKAHLTGPAGTEALLAILRTQPPCTFDQITQLTLGSLFGQSTEFILCNPSDELLSLFQPILQGQLQAIASTLPDSVDLTPNATTTEHPLDGLRRARAIMRFSPLLPLGLLLLITILAVRTLQDWLWWWGIPILVGGVIGIILAAAIHPIFQWAFITQIMPRIPEFLPDSFANTLRELIAAVLAGVAAPILFQSAMLMLLGIFMMLATRIRKPTSSVSDKK